MIYLALFVLFLPMIATFNCDHIKDNSSCVALNGCSWNQGQCYGIFSPICHFSECYYVDPLRGSDFSNGSSFASFRTLTAAFQELQGKNGSIIIINYAYQVEVELLGFTLINSTITVRYNYLFLKNTYSMLFRPLFDNNKYILNLKNFNISSLPSQYYKAISVKVGSLEIIGSIMNNLTIKKGIDSVFEVGNSSLYFTVSKFYRIKLN